MPCSAGKVHRRYANGGREQHVIEPLTRAPGLRLLRFERSNEINSMKQEHETPLLERKPYPGGDWYPALNCSRKSRIVIRLCIRALIFCVSVCVVGSSQRISAPNLGPVPLLAR